MEHPLVLHYLAMAELQDARREARYPAPQKGWKLFRRATRPGGPRPARAARSAEEEERVPALV